MSSSCPPHETTYRNAVNQIRSKIKDASDSSVHIYSFNVHPEQLEAAHALLDKSEGRRSMRVTYSDNHNFIVRYMPGLAHNDAHTFWTMAMAIALQALTQLPYPPVPPGCRGIGAITYEVGPGKKQADAGLRCSASVLPSVVLEVGSSESFIQLQTDAKLWIEDMPEVCLVILLFIDPPIAPYPTLPRFTIQLWRGFPAVHSRASQQREARMVWDADWTHVATPMYILLADIFRGGVPAAYGMNTHVYLDTAAWRQDIIDSWKLL